MDAVLGTDDLSTFFTLKVNVFIVFTTVYVFLNIVACCASKSKKKKSSCFCCKNHKKDEKQTLTES